MLFLQNALGSLTTTILGSQLKYLESLIVPRILPVRTIALENTDIFKHILKKVKYVRMAQ